MRGGLAVVLLGLGVLAAPLEAQTLRIEIDLSDQQMTVFEAGLPSHVWPVSTARAGKRTPIGSFTPYALERMHYSTLYDNAPMPWSIFFTGNYAIHGTTAVDRLGTPASAGCVRLAPENAHLLYEAVRAVGFAETRVVIHP
ncbi:L,D-transpeptidase [Salipiger sp. P9]|uniref:L,D-transpeptidase n=1 Tax=Salipiger pentaromativorans TaxID=2943193 RepID=UPI0021584358|nr:L,D-transpeptidase [Salipiger pentaromativorans]MCR8547374.1 L,D-transpeptidase [Salipiger pentaromativorans]